MKKLLVICILLPSWTSASPADEIATINLLFLNCGPAVLDVQVTCTDALYRQSHVAGPELFLFDDITGPLVQSVLLGASSSAQTSRLVSSTLSYVEVALRGGKTFEELRAQLAAQTATVVQSNREIEQVQRECEHAAINATGGIGGARAALGLCSVPVH
jgi:hypothetical protein